MKLTIRETPDATPPGSQDRLTVLLADLNSRQQEIQGRLDQENQFYITFFALFLTTIATLVVADKWTDLLTPVFQSLVPSMTLLLAIILLWLPLHETHQQLNFRVIAVYLTTYVVPEIRRLVNAEDSSPDPTNTGQAQATLLTWETFRNVRMLRPRFSHLLITLSLLGRASMLYAPALIVLGYYFIGADRLEPDHRALEICLIVVVALALALPIALFLYIACAPSLKLTDSEAEAAVT